MSAIAILFSFPASAQEEDAPEKIDLSNFPGEIVDQVVIPIPAEIFAVLDKLDEHDWTSGIELPEESGKTQDRAILALEFGSLVGEGFIAVQAKSSEDIEKIGRRVLELSESLGLASAVRPHSLAIIEASGRKDWEGVRSELDSTQQTVRLTMEKIRDEATSNLVSLGGWLRGTSVVTTLIADSYRADKAELLNQPGLVSHFRELLSAMPENAEIRILLTGLARMEAIITADETISEEDIEELRQISRSMLEQFYFLAPVAN